MKNFNQSAQGVSPEQTRAALQRAAQQRQKTMIEQQQPVPVLKPHGMGEDVIDRQVYRHKLSNDHRQAQRLNQRAQHIYQRDITALHARAIEKGKTQPAQLERTATPLDNSRKASSDFNVQAQPQPTKTLSW